MSFIYKTQDMSRIMGYKSVRTAFDSVTFKRPTPTTTASGDVTRTFAVVSGNPSSVPCVIEPYSRKSGEEIQGEALSNSTYVIINCPQQVEGVWLDVKSEDIAIVAAKGSQVARTLNIVSIERNSGVMLEMVAAYEE